MTSFGLRSPMSVVEMTTAKGEIEMTFDLFCSWADHCASEHGTIEANSYDELFEEMRKFFASACGFTGVEAFEISRP